MLHSEDWVESVLNQFILTVSPLIKGNQSEVATVVSDYESVVSHVVNHDKTKYGFLGSGPLPKRKFVWRDTYS